MKKVSVGSIFHGFTVLERLPDVIRPNGKKRPLWKCQCTCGEIRGIESQCLVSKNKPLCKCRGREYIKTPVILHGLSNTPTYNSWQSARQRCLNPKETGYENYGGRGITICDRWLEPEGKGFLNFLEDMGERPEGTTLDRINVNGNYEPNNCRWADRNTQAFNRRPDIHNTSGRTGVYWFKRVSKWIACIFVNNKQTHLGYFTEFEDAVRARENAELKYFGKIKDA